MGGHGEAALSGLKGFGFGVDGALGTPPPLAVHIGAVGGVHEADNRVIDMTVQGQAIIHYGAAIGKRKCRRVNLGRARKEFIRRDINPDELPLLAHGVSAHFYFLGFHSLLRRESRYFFARPILYPKAPAMIGAFDCAVFDTSLREGRGAVRANIAHRKKRAAILAAGLAANTDGLARNFAAQHFAPADIRGQPCKIPDVENETVL